METIQALGEWGVRNLENFEEYMKCFYELLPFVFSHVFDDEKNVYVDMCANGNYSWGETALYRSITLAICIFVYVTLLATLAVLKKTMQFNSNRAAFCEETDTFVKTLYENASAASFWRIKAKKWKRRMVGNHTERVGRKTIRELKAKLKIQAQTQKGYIRKLKQQLQAKQIEDTDIRVQLDKIEKKLEHTINEKDGFAGLLIVAEERYMARDRNAQEYWMALQMVGKQVQNIKADADLLRNRMRMMESAPTNNKSMTSILSLPMVNEAINMLDRIQIPTSPTSLSERIMSGSPLCQRSIENMSMHSSMESLRPAIQDYSLSSNIATGKDVHSPTNVASHEGLGQPDKPVMTDEVRRQDSDSSIIRQARVLERIAESLKGDAGEAYSLENIVSSWEPKITDLVSKSRKGILSSESSLLNIGLSDLIGCSNEPENDAHGEQQSQSLDFLDKQSGTPRESLLAEKSATSITDGILQTNMDVMDLDLVRLSPETVRAEQQKESPVVFAPETPLKSAFDILNISEPPTVNDVRRREEANSVTTVTVGAATPRFNESSEMHIVGSTVEYNAPIDTKIGDTLCNTETVLESTDKPMDDDESKADKTGPSEGDGSPREGRARRTAASEAPYKYPVMELLENVVTKDPRRSTLPRRSPSAPKPSLLPFVSSRRSSLSARGGGGRGGRGRAHSLSATRSGKPHPEAGTSMHLKNVGKAANTATETRAKRRSLPNMRQSRIPALSGNINGTSRSPLAIAANTRTQPLLRKKN